jgi:transcriptional regulator with XRE-family HTH domain
MNSNLNIEIGKLFRSRREEIGMSISALSEVAGITRRTIYQVESGNPGMSIGTLVKISDALKCSISFNLFVPNC